VPSCGAANALPGSAGPGSASMACSFSSSFARMYVAGDTLAPSPVRLTYSWRSVMASLRADCSSPRSVVTSSPAMRLAFMSMRIAGQKDNTDGDEPDHPVSLDSRPDARYTSVAHPPGLCRKARYPTAGFSCAVCGLFLARRYNDVPTQLPVRVDHPPSAEIDRGFVGHWVRVRSPGHGRLVLPERAVLWSRGGSFHALDSSH